MTRGRTELAGQYKERTLPLDLFVREMTHKPPHRVPGTAVYMHGGTATPPALLHNLKHNKVLHERVLLLRVVTEEIPYVEREERVRCESLGADIWRVDVRYGFSQDPHIPAALAQCPPQGVPFRPMETTYFLGRENLIPVKGPRLHMWRSRLFALLSRNALGATAFFHLPPNRVVELGTQIEI